MIIEIALGIVLAVVILAFLPLLIQGAVWLVGVALLIGGIVLIIFVPEVQVIVAIVATAVAALYAYEFSKKFWEPPLRRIEWRMRLSFATLGASFFLGGLCGFGLLGNAIYQIAEPGNWVAATFSISAATVLISCGGWMVIRERKNYTRTHKRPDELTLR